MKNSMIIILLFLAVNVVNGQEKDTRLDGLEEEIEQLIKTYNAIGLSVIVVENDKTVYSQGFGYRNLEKKLPVTENTSFHIASMTKAFTASLLGILEGEGHVSLTQKPSFYIPKFQFYNNEMDNLITIESLLSHKSGLGSLDGSLVLFGENNRLKSLAKLKYLKPNGKINDSWLYSNVGYTIVGTVAEQVTSKSWDENIEEKIFRPLNMNNSFTSLEKMKSSNNYSLGYGVSAGKVQNVSFEKYYDYSPAGAIKSSSKDIGNWMRTWLNDGSFNGKNVLPKDYVYSATSIQNIRDGGDSKGTFLFGDGFGWRMESRNGHYKVHHGGNTSGFSSIATLYPFSNLGIAILCNQQNSTLPYLILDLITNRMLELPRNAISDYPLIISDIYTDDNKIKGLNEEKKPTNELTNFCGKYFHKGYGTLEIVKKDNSLFVVYPNFTYRLEHLHYNTFKMKLGKGDAQILNPDFFELNFHQNNEGKIGSIKINLQYEPVEFIKETDK